jgi:acyl-coenzyme A synthetase/AMP-(fatty) acid ligase
LWGDKAGISLSDLALGTCLGGRLPELSGRSVLIATRDQFAAALALAELDGIARRLIICPPDLRPEHLPAVIAHGEADAIVSDYAMQGDIDIPLRVMCSFALMPAEDIQVGVRPTEWMLLTSGTAGAPKLVVHTLHSLSAHIQGGQDTPCEVTWGTFYDTRRYGGLQILLRALLGCGSFVMSGTEEPVSDYLLRLGAHNATHISGTPSHWRRVLMSPQARAIAPRYVRLSGEIADQAILNALSSFYPQARIAHAFASTEAGVAFEVNDGLEGFPANMLSSPGDVEMKIDDGSLRIRSARTALRYATGQDGPIADHDSFVDTGDMVELRGDRYYFLGRRNGVINIGGLKVYPEEVEAVINCHPAVRMSIVRSRSNPITGSIVAADIVLKPQSGPAGANGRLADFRREILRICHERLAPHKIPATIRCVPALEVAEAGKLVRHHA